MDLVAKVNAVIDQHRLLSKGDTVIVAVSGGADSIALLHVLAAVREEWNLALLAAHLDHGLRAGSGADAGFVSQVAAQWRVPAVLETADVRALARKRKLSLEAAGREARYAFLDRLAREHGAQRVATGHTQGDQIETVAMRLLRGDPWDALAGIPVARPLVGATIIRPLLGVTREEIRSYLASQRIAWREDPTNVDLRFLRNWVRLQLLPALDRTVPQARDLLWELSRSMQEADRMLTDLATARVRAVAQVDGREVRFPLGAFRRHPTDLQRRMLRWAAVWAAGTPGGLPVVVQMRGLRTAVAGRTGDSAKMGEAVVRVGYGMVDVVPSQPPARRAEYRLAVPGRVSAEAFGVTIAAELLETPAISPPPSAHSDEVHLDAATVGRELTVRSWRPGDRMIPLGMRGKKKVQDLFVDDKVPRWERDRTPVVTDAQGRILWIIGRRIAEAGRITASTRRVVRLTVRRVPAGPAAFARNTPGDAVIGLA